MKDVLTLKKASRALKLSIQLTRTIVRIPANDEASVTVEMFRNALFDSTDDILTQVNGIDVRGVSDVAYEHLCQIMDDAEYDPGIAARESESGFFLDLDTIVMRLRRQLELAHNANERLLPTTRFWVGVDGSRQSYLAFEVTSRLRRQGTITVLHINEDQSAKTIQMPVISSDFITQEYKSHANRLRIPANRITIDSIHDGSPSSSSVATHLLDACAKQIGAESSTRGEADFLVLGAIGKGGPAIEQVAHVPRDVLRFTPIPVILVPPSPVPYATVMRSSTFVVAIDQDVSLGMRCLNAALKLMRPIDVLRIVHCYDPPVASVFQTQPFDVYHNILERTHLQGVVDFEPLERGWTIAESLQDYSVKHGASVLILGLGGASCERQNEEGVATETTMGRVTTAMLQSPRTVLCICP